MKLRIEAYADDTTTVDVEVSTDLEVAVITEVFTKLNAAASGYGPVFKVSELGTNGVVGKGLVSFL